VAIPPLNLGAEINNATSKTTPVDADELALADSAASYVLKKLTWANLKATLKTYLDTLYVALTGNQTIAGNKTFSGQTELTGQAATNATSAMTRGLVYDEDLLNRVTRIQSRNWGGGTFVGSGFYGDLVSSFVIYTLTTTGSSAYLEANTNADLPFSARGNLAGYIYWGERFRVSFPFQYSGSDANTKIRATVGRQHFVPVVGDLSSHGIGFIIENNSLKLQVHDGTTLTTTASLATLSVSTRYVITLDSNGSGTTTIYVNGTSVGSTTGSPTTSSTHVGLNVSVANGAGTSDCRYTSNNEILILAGAN